MVVNMSKTLLDIYLQRTTTQERNRNPREEGIIATISDIIERENSFENTPKATAKLHEFHKMLIDRSKVKDDDELERVATMMTMCLTMSIMTKHINRNKSN